MQMRDLSRGTHSVQETGFFRFSLRVPVWLIAVLWLSSTVFAEENSKVTSHTYKTIGDVKLAIHVVAPSDHKPSDKRPAIVFFFGGGWRAGTTKQFAPHCHYLASRGMVAMAADYRVSSRHNTQVIHCVADAKSAMRWVRAHADRLGIDPDRIASGGGSAGGHLAAATALIKGMDEEGEDLKVSSLPDAMALFNPAVDITAKGLNAKADSKKYSEIVARIGTDPENVSPAQHIRGGLPPTVIFHGTADTAVPFAQVERFTKLMKKAGNRCELHKYEDRPHGFFNFGRGKGERRNIDFMSSMVKLDQFLTSLGYIEGEPTVKGFEFSQDHIRFDK